jgi:hypothetical protein
MQSLASPRTCSGRTTSEENLIVSADEIAQILTAQFAA